MVEFRGKLTRIRDLIFGPETSQESSPLEIPQHTTHREIFVGIQTRLDQIQEKIKKETKDLLDQELERQRVLRLENETLQKEAEEKARSEQEERSRWSRFFGEVRSEIDPFLDDLNKAVFSGKARVFEWKKTEKMCGGRTHSESVGYPPNDHTEYYTDPIYWDIRMEKWLKIPGVGSIVVCVPVEEGVYEARYFVDNNAPFMDERDVSTKENLQYKAKAESGELDEFEKLIVEDALQIYEKTIRLKP